MRATEPSACCAHDTTEAGRGHPHTGFMVTQTFIHFTGMQSPPTSILNFKTTNCKVSCPTHKHPIPKSILEIFNPDTNPPHEYLPGMNSCQGADVSSSSSSSSISIRAVGCMSTIRRPVMEDLHPTALMTLVMTDNSMCMLPCHCCSSTAPTKLEAPQDHQIKTFTGTPSS